MTKAFENTERDRLLWRSRAWEAEEQNRELRAWKESAMTELARWYAVWEALGQPGALGEIRAVAALAEVKRLRSAVPVVDDATRQEVEALIAAIRAMRPDPTEPCPPGWDADDRQGDRNIYRAAELLAAAYLGRTDGND